MKEAIQVLIISVALAADAVSVTLAIGMRTPDQTQKQAIGLALPFGFFQGTMTILGWAMGIALAGLIALTGSVIGFFLLSLIGLKMIHEGLSNSQGNIVEYPSSKKIFLLSIATSIDALVIGTTIAILDLPLGFAAMFIALTTSILVYIGYFFSKYVGRLFGRYSEVGAGVILIIVGISLVAF